MADSGLRSARLKPAQTRALAALLTERDVAAAARAADVGERTLHRWLRHNEAFIAALQAAQAEALAAALRRLTGLTGDALATVADIMRNGESEANRLRAAALALEMYCRLRELSELDARVTALEERMQCLGK